MDEEPKVQEYLDGIARRCRRLTPEEMVRNFELELERHRSGFGHYLFHLDRPAIKEWSVPGALKYEIVKCKGGYEVLMQVHPFKREELTLEVEGGMLDVVAVHTEKRGGKVVTEVTSRAEQRIPLPSDTRPDKVKARFEGGLLRINIPTSMGKRVRVQIQ